MKFQNSKQSRPLLELKNVKTFSNELLSYRITHMNILAEIFLKTMLHSFGKQLVYVGINEKYTLFYQKMFVQEISREFPKTVRIFQY